MSSGLSSKLALRLATRFGHFSVSIFSTLVEVDMHVDKYQTGECALSPNTQVQNELELFVKVIEQIHQSYCDLCTRVLLTY